MTGDTLERVRGALRHAGIVRTDKEFCEAWLGKSECYMRVLRYNHTEPSADAMANCAARLGVWAAQLRRDGEVRKRQWADVFEDLRVECYTAMDKQATSRLHRKGVCM